MFWMAVYSPEYRSLLLNLTRTNVPSFGTERDPPPEPLNSADDIGVNQGMFSSDNEEKRPSTLTLHLPVNVGSSLLMT